MQKTLPNLATNEERQLANVDPEPHQRNEDIKDEAFLFISALSGMVSTDNDIWLIDSGASRHMTGYRDHLLDLVEKETSLHVVLGDNARYNVKGLGTSTFQLDYDIPLQLSEVLYVPRMKRNLVSISALENKGLLMFYAIIIVLCISIDKSNIRTRSLRNTHSQETQHLSWETL
jgi:hypothetical protein